MQPRANSSKALSAKPCFRIGLSPPRRGRKHKACWSASILFGAPILYGGSHNYDDSFPSPEKKRIKTRHQFLAPPLKETAAKDGSTSENSSSSWFRLFKLRKQLVSVSAIPDKQELPVTVQDTTDMVAANCPVFFFHHDERYFPCTVEFFLEQCRLVRVAKGWKRNVIEVLADYGILDAETLAREQAKFDQEKKISESSFKSKKGGKRRRQFLQLQLDPASRTGEGGDVAKIPIYATIKETLDPLLGRRDGIEINYMKFLAFNGAYKLFRTLWVGPLGAHDADWEHVTVRLTPDGKEVVGVYYSAHRHRDGLWRSADEVPRSKDGRPLAYIAENGHGSYPVAGTIWRLFGVINDYTSDTGVKWDPEKVVLVTQYSDDKLPGVVSRGSSLNGSTYKSPSQDIHHSHNFPKVERQDAAWLRYEGKWGGEVDAPQKQEWYVRAENPISRTWLQQLFFPLLPGVQSIWEPAVEEVDEALDNLKMGMDEGMEAFRSQADEVKEEFEASRRVAYKRWRNLVKEVRRRASDSKD